MKKLLGLILLAGSLTFAEAAPIKKPSKDLTEEQKELLAKMEARLDEIKAMDFNSLSKEEIKELRAEMKEMKKEAEGKGIYLSVGAIIIILLVLILII